MSLLELRDITAGYDKNIILKNLNLNVEKGELVSLLGPSGCGKTTTLRLIAGFSEPVSGNFFFNNKDYTKIPLHKRNFGFVFQSYALFPHMNIYDNVAFGLRQRKLPESEIKTKVMDMLHTVDLDGFEKRLPKEMSGGQRQRVALARAMVINPDLMLFDEPLSNLDAKLRVSMRTEIRRIQQEAGITAIYVTHDQSEAMAISDKVIIMNKGLVEQISTPQEAYYYPNNQFVADFIGEANFLKATVDAQDMVNINGSKVKCATGSLAVGGDCNVVLRPEGASLSDTGMLKVKVVYSCFMGPYQDYHVAVGDTLVKIQDYNPKNSKIYKVGDEAYLNFADNTLYAL